MDSDTDMQRHRARRGYSICELTAFAALGTAACEQPADKTAQASHPQQAGQPVNPCAVAGHIAAAREGLVLGDSRGPEGHVKAVADDLTRSMRIADASRPNDHEAARAAVRPLAGVRTSLWLDRENFIVMVGDQKHRSMAMIDQICAARRHAGGRRKCAGRDRKESRWRNHAIAQLSVAGRAASAIAGEAGGGCGGARAETGVQTTATKIGSRARK